MARGGPVPIEWYLNSSGESIDSLFWESGGEETAALAIEMLGLKEDQRVLDLACGIGGRTIGLCRGGLDVTAHEARPQLLEVAGAEADTRGLWPNFLSGDPRYLEVRGHFHAVLSLGGGALEHFDYDEEIRKACAAAARALRSEGRLLMQIPNVLHIEAHLTERNWIETDATLEMIEQHWNAGTRRLEGTRRTVVLEDMQADLEPVPFQRRLFTLDELVDLFASVGMLLGDVFDEHGRRCVPTDAEQQLFVEARLID